MKLSLLSDELKKGIISVEIIELLFQKLSFSDTCTLTWYNYMYVICILPILHEYDNLYSQSELKKFSKV